MALSSLTALDQFKAAPFPPGYPDTTRTFYSPVDQVHEALKALLTSANKSIVVAMYGYDDPELPFRSHAMIRSAWAHHDNDRHPVGWPFS